MAFKLNISDKGKAWRIELDSELLVGKSIGESIEGKDINPDLDGYVLEIRGGTDFAGFPMYEKVEGIGMKRVLFTKGWGMHDSRKGIRKRKTVRGKTISEKTVQINMVVSKEGSKKLSEIFPEQNKLPELEVKEIKEEKKESTEKLEEKIEEKMEEKAEEEVIKEAEKSAEEKKPEEKKE